MRTLVIAAYPPELVGLRQANVVARAVGVGLVEASAGAERAIAAEKPQRILLVGTAGVLPSCSATIGDVVVAARAELVVRAVEYVPAIMPTVVPADPELSETCARTIGAARVTVASAVGVTSSDPEATRLGARAQVEQLECFAVLAAAARARIPATAILAIANRVGATAQAEWRVHRERAEATALRALARVLAQP
jgi:nucleoside phosphorylase